MENQGQPQSTSERTRPVSGAPATFGTTGTPTSWRLAILATIVATGLLAFALRGSIGLRGQAVAGVICFFGLVALCSSNLRAVNWRTIGWGFGLQLILALLVLNGEIVLGGRRYSVKNGLE